MNDISINPIVGAYSRVARDYDSDSNLDSCWGKVTRKAIAGIRQNLRPNHNRIVEVGCGTGRQLLLLASESHPDVQFVGVDPAPNMRRAAAERVAHHPNVQIRNGSFERLPLEDASVDYLYSILAFHWVTDLPRAVDELARVLRPGAEMDLIFDGRYNGQEFIRKTSPVYLKYMGLAALVQSAQMRKQMCRETALALFTTRFPVAALSVDESYDTYYDTLDAHWSWWIRVEGHFTDIPADKKQQCDREVRMAMSSLDTGAGIPYTIHLLHVRLRRA